MSFDEQSRRVLLGHEERLHASATRSTDAMHRHDEAGRRDGPRLSFWQDSDRILHSFSFNRYVDKTQVFSNIEDDRISHRVIHVQFLAKIGRFIGRVLELNEDLIEAIALGHDVGHCPFGHEGEKMLDTACVRHGIGHFHHNAQGIVFLDHVESAYRYQANGFPGLNLAVQTLDGILCHDGETHVRELAPCPVDKHDPGDAFERLDENLDRTIQSANTVDLQPMTIEACIVRFVDTISYIGRDIEDAITLGLITRDEVPDTVLGNTNRQIIDVLVKDLIHNTETSRFSKVAHGKEVHQALLELYDFNMERIYKHEMLASKIKDVPVQIEAIFEQALDDIVHRREQARVYRDHVDLIGREYLEKNKGTPAIIARDFVAGMTDRYFTTLARAISRTHH